MFKEILVIVAVGHFLLTSPLFAQEYQSSKSPTGSPPRPQRDTVARKIVKVSKKNYTLAYKSLTFPKIYKYIFFNNFVLEEL